MLLIRLLWWLLHHIRSVLEHLVGQVEGALLVDIVCRGALPNINVPKAQHLVVALDLNLRLPITRGDRRTVRCHAGRACLLADIGGHVVRIVLASCS